jgi:effector-binding domain-containing protein
MDSEVTVADVPARRTAVIAVTTTWQEFPTLWGQLSGEVWACLRAGGIERGCRNVILYLDQAPRVEIGVLLDQPCLLTGRVVASTLPAGKTATIVHRGSFADLRTTHDALVGWCAAHGHRLTGTRWEVYGPHNNDPAQQWTQISWLLSPATS